MELLLPESLPIACDILLLPEIPTNAAASGHDHPDPDPDTDWVTLPQHVCNPCGRSNVLVINDMLPSWKQVLLSLTSCALLHEDETGLLLRLPVEPVPSTFSFSLTSDGDPENENDTTTTASTTTDLYVDWDVTLARQLWNERRAEPRTAGAVPNHNDDDDDDDGTALVEATALTKPPERDEQQEIKDPTSETPFRQDHDLTSDRMDHLDLLTQGRPSSQDDTDPAVPLLPLEPLRDLPDRIDDGHHHHHHHHHHSQKSSSSSSSSRIDQELEALQKVQFIMEQDAANLDRLIQVLGLVGLFLLGLLLWSGYQLLRAQQEDCRARDVRRAVERKLLMQSARSASRSFRMSQHSLAAAAAAAAMGPRSAGSQMPEHPTASTLTDQPPQHDFCCTPRIDNRSRNRMMILSAQPVTPTRLDFSQERVSSSSSSCARESLVRSPAVGHRVPMVSPSSPPIFARNPCFPTTAMASDVGDTTTTTTTTTSKDASLSPCSRFAKTWQAQKNTRRHRRRTKKGSHNHPPLRLQPWGVPTGGAHHWTLDGSAGNGLVLASMPMMEPLAGSRFEPHSDTAATDLLAVSITNKETPFASNFCHETAKVIPESMNTCDTKNAPAQSSPSVVPPPIPELVCTTPSSSESFVDDYW